MSEKWKKFLETEVGSVEDIKKAISNLDDEDVFILSEAIERLKTGNIVQEDGVKKTSLLKLKMLSFNKDDIEGLLEEIVNVIDVVVKRQDKMERKIHSLDNQG